MPFAPAAFAALARVTQRSWNVAHSLEFAGSGSAMFAPTYSWPCDFTAVNSVTIHDGTLASK